MFQTKFLLNNISIPLPVSPFRYGNSNNGTVNTQNGTGTSINNMPSPGGTIGNFVLNIVPYRSTVKGTGSGWVNVLPPTTSGHGNTLLGNKLSSGSNYWPGVGVGWADLRV